MNMLQAHGTTTHELTKNTAGQCQLQGSHNRMTVANAMDAPNAKQTFNMDKLISLYYTWAKYNVHV